MTSFKQSTVHADHAHPQDQCSGAKQYATTDPATTGCFSTAVPTKSGTCPKGSFASIITFEQVGDNTIQAPSICTAGLEVKSTSVCGFVPVRSVDICENGCIGTDCPLILRAGGSYAYTGQGLDGTGIVIKGLGGAAFDIASIDVAMALESGTGCFTDADYGATTITITGEWCNY